MPPDFLAQFIRREAACFFTPHLGHPVPQTLWEIAASYSFPHTWQIHHTLKSLPPENIVGRNPLFFTVCHSFAISGCVSAKEFLICEHALSILKRSRLRSMSIGLCTCKGFRRVHMFDRGSKRSTTYRSNLAKLSFLSTFSVAKISSALKHYITYEDY